MTDQQPQGEQSSPTPSPAPVPVQQYNHPGQQHWQQPAPHRPQPAPDHKSRLIWHLVFLLAVEPVVLGTLVFITGITLILFPIALFLALVWLGLAAWHIIAIILAIIGLSNEGRTPPPPYYQQPR